MKIVVLIISLLISRAVAQSPATASRYDNFVWQTVYIQGNNVYAATNSPIIRVCNYPSSGVPCTNLASTFTDITMAVGCPASAQIVLGKGMSCQATADKNGAFGFWIASGTYDYTVTVGGHSYGPYTITVGGGGTSGPPASSTIVDVSKYPGSDMCAQIVAAAAAQPGKILDARSFGGTQPCHSNPFAGTTANMVIYFGDVIINTFVPWQTNSVYDTILYGAGRGSNGRGTTLVAAPGFPSTCDGLTVGCPVLRLGDFSGGTNGAFGHRIENFSVDCNNQPGGIGIYSNDIQEQSGAIHFQVLNCPVYGVYMDGTYGQGKGAENYYFEDGEVYPQSSTSQSTVGMKIVGNNPSATAFRKLENITVGCSRPTNCGAGYSFENTTGGILMGLNAEGTTTGYDIGPNNNVVGGITGIHMVCGAQANVGICVHIHTGTGMVNLQGVENGSGNITIQDDTARPTASTITDFFMSYYITTDNGAIRFSSSHYSQNAGNGNLFTSMNVNSLNGQVNPFSVRMQADFGLTMMFDSGVNNPEGVAFVFNDRGSGKWTIQNTGGSGGPSNTNAFQVFDMVGNIPRLFMTDSVVNTGYTILDSAGASAVSINKGAGSGTGGFEVCAGGATCNFTVDSGGVVHSQGNTGLTGTVAIGNSGCSLTFTGGIVTGHSGTSCP